MKKSAISTSKAKESPWVEVCRRRLEGDIRVGREGRHVEVYYEVVERRMINGKSEQRCVVDYRVVHTNEIVSHILSDIVSRILPEIENAAFAKIENDMKLRWEGRDLVLDVVRLTPLAKALLGQDPF